MEDFMDFKGKRVVVIGDVILDRYYYGNAIKLCQEGPVADISEPMIEEWCGAAGIVAKVMAEAGCEVTLITILGTDRWGDIILGDLKGINVEYSRCVSRQTYRKKRIYADNQLLLRMSYGHYPQPKEDIEQSFLYEKLLESLVSADIVVVSDYGKCVLDDVTLGHVRDLARCPVICDPCMTRKWLPYRDWIFCPNKSEYEVLREQCWPSLAFVSKGHWGLELRQEGGRSYSVDAITQTPRCVTGAGDVVTAHVALGLVAGLEVTSIVSLANVAAGMAVGMRGNLFPSYKNAVSEWVKRCGT